MEAGGGSMEAGGGDTEAGGGSMEAGGGATEAGGGATEDMQWVVPVQSAASLTFCLRAVEQDAPTQKHR